MLHSIHRLHIVKCIHSNSTYPPYIPYIHTPSIHIAISLFLYKHIFHISIYHPFHISYSDLSEFGLNSRHPDPRRVWNGGPSRGWWHPYPRDQRDPSRSAHEFHLAPFDCQARYLRSCRRSRIMFFGLFFRRPRAKHLLLRPFLDTCHPKELSKSMILCGTSLKQSNKRRTIAHGVPARCIFDFFRKAPSRKPTFETSSERRPVGAKI